MNLQGKPKYSEETCPSATLSTTKSHMTTRSGTPDRSGGKPATPSDVLLLVLLRGWSSQARTIPTERPPLVGEVSAYFSGFEVVAWSAQQSLISDL
jgi:hypothetical protein